MEHRLIFFVDDEKAILNLLEYTFSSRDGYEVRTFSSGEDCISSLKDNPDLVVLDHMLWPRNNSSWSGLDVLKEIRKAGYDMPVLVLSGNHEKELIDEYYACGATKYIVKNSFFIDTLIEAIKKELNTPKR